MAKRVSTLETANTSLSSRVSTLENNGGGSEIENLNSRLTQLEQNTDAGKYWIIRSSSDVANRIDTTFNCQCLKAINNNFYVFSLSVDNTGNVRNANNKYISFEFICPNINYKYLVINMNGYYTESNSSTTIDTDTKLKRMYLSVGGSDIDIFNLNGYNTSPVTFSVDISSLNLIDSTPKIYMRHEKDNANFNEFYRISQMYLRN